jgi:hypothetical protein
MTFGFPAFADGSCHLELRKEILSQIVGEALTKLGWDYQSPLPTHFTVQIPCGWASWGEKMIITVNAGGTISARSESILTTQCFDWGKNQKNIDLFFNQLSQLADLHVSRGRPEKHDTRSPLEKILND